MKAEICNHCGIQLNRSRHVNIGLIRWKSCPSCSVKDGKEHVFLRYPEAFGTTEKRVTFANPDGIQSHCQDCRNLLSPTAEVMSCSEVEGCRESGE